MQSRRFGGISKATKAKAAPVLGAGFGAMAQWEEGGKTMRNDEESTAETESLWLVISV